VSQERVVNTPGAACKRIFIGGLKTTTDDDTIRAYFSQFGEVELVDVPEDKVNRHRRGFGYVTFTDNDPVDKVTSQ
jgi:RNA recognition motif-containing protein